MIRFRSDHHLQYPAAFRDRHERRDDEAPVGAQEHRRRQGRHRQCRTHLPATGGDGAGLHPAFGRRPDSPLLHGGGRSRLHLRCIQHRARLCADLQNAALAGDFKAALAIQDKLVPLQVATFLEAGVTGAKYGLSLLAESRRRCACRSSPERRRPRTAFARRWFTPACWRVRDSPCPKTGSELQGRRREPQGALQLRDWRTFDAGLALTGTE